MRDQASANQEIMAEITGKQEPAHIHKPENARQHARGQRIAPAKRRAVPGRDFVAAQTVVRYLIQQISPKIGLKYYRPDA